jgi:hypothetical protein
MFSWVRFEKCRVNVGVKLARGLRGIEGKDERSFDSRVVDLSEDQLNQNSPGDQEIASVQRRSAGVITGMTAERRRTLLEPRGSLPRRS